MYCRSTHGLIAESRHSIELNEYHARASEEIISAGIPVQWSGNI